MTPGSPSSPAPATAPSPPANDLKYTAAHPDEPRVTESTKGGFGGITHRFDLFKPIIAAVNGYALGGGFEMALACDIIVAADHARFGLPEPTVGLMAGAGGAHRLPRHVPLKVAMGMMLTGRHVTAQEAEQRGLVNQVVPLRRSPHHRRGLGQPGPRLRPPLHSRDQAGRLPGPRSPARAGYRPATTSGGAAPKTPRTASRAPAPSRKSASPNGPGVNASPPPAHPPPTRPSRSDRHSRTPRRHSRESGNPGQGRGAASTGEAPFPLMVRLSNHERRTTPRHDGTAPTPPSFPRRRESRGSGAGLPPQSRRAATAGIQGGVPGWRGLPHPPNLAFHGALPKGLPARERRCGRGVRAWRWGGRRRPGGPGCAGRAGLPGTWRRAAGPRRGCWRGARRWCGAGAWGSRAARCRSGRSRR